MTPWSRPAVYPPSTGRACPVMNDASSESRKAAAAGDLFGATQPAQFVLLHDVGQRVLHAGPAEDALQHRGVDEPGAHRVHPDAASAVVDGHVLGEQDDTALRRAVGTSPGRSLQPFDTGDRHQGPASTVHRGLAQHLRHDVLGHEIRPGQIDGEDPLPVLLRQGVHRPASGHPGRMHQAGHVAAERHGGFDQLLDRRLVGHVGAGEGPGAVAGPVAGRAMERLVDIGPHDEGPFCEEPVRRGPADPRGRASHDVGALLQSLHESPPRCGCIATEQTDKSCTYV